MAAARGDKSGTLLSTIFRPVASQPLSTEERIGVIAAPVGGQRVSLAPLRWSYQLEYCPPGSSRSIRSSVPIVFDKRATPSAWLIRPRRSAATALHMYAPMLVVEVCTLRDPSASRLSAGSPD